MLTLSVTLTIIHHFLIIYSTTIQATTPAPGLLSRLLPSLLVLGSHLPQCLLILKWSDPLRRKGDQFNPLPKCKQNQSKTKIPSATLSKHLKGPVRPDSCAHSSLFPLLSHSIYAAAILVCLLCIAHAKAFQCQSFLGLESSVPDLYIPAQKLPV